MSTVQIPEYKTDAFFGLEDKEGITLVDFKIEFGRNKDGETETEEIE